MQRLTLAGGIPETSRGSIVALGNFDGFHLGHQAVVGRAVQRAFHERRPVIVATFDPHPVRYFKPDVPPFRLTTLDQRERCSPMPAPTRCWCSSSARSCASTDAEEFVDRSCWPSGSAPPAWSPATTSASARAAAAMSSCSATLGAQHGIAAEAVAPVLLDGDAHLVGPHPRGADRRRHRPRDPADEPRLSRSRASSRRGDKRGRELGYPTANLVARRLPAARATAFTRCG